MIHTLNSLIRGISLLIGGVLRLLLVAYQWVVSPVLHMLAPGCGCRFYPTCSQYAREALAAHGPIKGCWLILRRLGRCHPLGGHGFDPVPLKTNSPKVTHG